MKTAICIASGPSLTKEDVEYCRGKGLVYAVKECRHLAPWADVLYAADTDWWEKFNGCPDFAGRKVTVSEDAAQKYGLELIKYRADILWSTQQGLIATGGNSGFQAINLAALDLMREFPEDEKQIIITGYDMGFKPGMDKHWWEKEHARESRPSDYVKWLQHIDKAAPFIKASGITVLNVSVQSSITSFPRVVLREVI